MEKDQTLGQIIWHSMISPLKMSLMSTPRPLFQPLRRLSSQPELLMIASQLLFCLFVTISYHPNWPFYPFMSFLGLKKKNLIVLYWKCQTLLFSIHRFPRSSFPKRRLNPSQQASFVLCPHTSPLLLPIPALLYPSPNTTNLQISTEISPPLWSFP